MPFYEEYPEALKSLVLDNVFIKYPHLKVRFALKDTISRENEEYILTLAILIWPDSFTELSLKPGMLRFIEKSEAIQKIKKIKAELESAFKASLVISLETARLQRMAPGNFEEILSQNKKLKISNRIWALPHIKKDVLLVSCFGQSRSVFQYCADKIWKIFLDHYSAFYGDNLFKELASSKENRKLKLSCALLDNLLEHLIQNNSLSDLKTYLKSDFQIIQRYALVTNNRKLLNALTKMTIVDEELINHSVMSENFFLLEKTLKEKENQEKLNSLVEAKLKSDLNYHFIADLLKMAEHQLLKKYLTTKNLYDLLMRLNSQEETRAFINILFQCTPPITADFIKEIHDRCKEKKQFINDLIHTYQFAKLYNLSSLVEVLEKSDISKQEIYPLIVSHKMQGKSQPISISDIIFAHIQNDHEASGSELEGSTLQENCQYLNSLISRVLEEPGLEKSSLSSSLKSALKETHISGMFLELGMWGNEIAKVANSDTPLEKRMNLRSELIEKMQINLYQQSRICIPGGYAGKPGHAMIYEIVIEKGDIILKIFNTGDGIENHLMQGAPNATRYAPVLAYRLPTSSLSSAARLNCVSDILHQLVKPKIEPVWAKYNTHNAKDIYEMIGKINDHYKGEEINLPGLTDTYIKPQRSGICTWKVMMALARKEFAQAGKHQEYSQFKLYVKFTALQDYIKTNNLTLAQLRQANFALENISRLANKCLSKHWLPEDQIKNIQQELAKIKLIIDNRKAFINKEEPELGLSKNLAPKILNFSLDLSGFSRFTSKAISEAEIEETLWKFPDLIGENTLKTLENVDEYLAILKKGKSEIAPQQISEIIENCIEQGCELSVDQFEKLSAEKREILIKSLFKILHEYNLAIAKQGGQPLAHRSLIGCKIYGLAHLLGQIHFASKPEMLQSLHSQFYDFMYYFKVQLTYPQFLILSDKSHRDLSTLQNLQRDSLINKSNKTEENSLFHALMLDSPKIQEEILISRKHNNLFSEAELESSAALESYIQAKKQKEKILKENDGEKSFEKEFNLAIIFNEIRYESICCYEGNSATVLNGSSLDVSSPNSYYSLLSIEQQNWSDSQIIKGRKQLEINTNHALRRNIPPKSLQESFPPLKDPQIVQTLKGELDENAIVAKISITHQGPLLRFLSQIRSSSSLKVLTTLEFIKTHSHLLSSSDVQQVVLYNLFSDDFFDEINRNPEFMKYLIEFITKETIAQAKMPTLSNQVELMLRIRTILLQMLSNSAETSSREYLEKLIKSDAYLKNHLHKYHDSRFSSEKQTKILQVCQSLIISKSIQLAQSNKNLDEEILSDYLEALCFWEQYSLGKNEKYDVFKHLVSHHVFKTGTMIMELMNKKKLSSEALIKILKPILAQYDIHLTSAAIIELPLVKMGDLKINLNTMAITQSGMKVCNLPDEFTQHPDFIAFFGKNKIFKGLVSRNHQYCRFTDNDTGKSYQFYIHDPSSGDLQAQLAFQGKKQWYTYCPLASLAKLEEPLLKLPHTLFDRDRQHWVSSFPHHKKLLILEKNKVAFVGDLEKNALIPIDKNGRLSKYQLVPDQALHKLSSSAHRQFGFFESYKFIEIYQHADNTNDIILKLPRYDLSFKFDGGKWIWIEDPKYILDFDKMAKSPLDDINAILHLKTEDALPNRLVLIPKQKFRTAVSSDGTPTLPTEFKKLIYDTSNITYAHEFESALPNMSQEQISHTLQNPANHRYLGKENYLVLKMGATLSPQENTEIAYLLMGLRQHELAFQALQQPVATPTLQLVGSLMKIIKEVPTEVGDQNASSSVSFGASATAVRMLALYQLIAIKNQHPKNFVKPVIYGSEDPSDTVEKWRMGSVAEFFTNSNLCVQFVEHYDLYLKLKHNIPIEMQMPEKIEYEMLQFFQQHNILEVYPQMEYRYRQLELNILYARKEMLNSSKDIKQQHELKKIEEQIHHHQRFYFKKQILQQTWVSLAFSKVFLMDLYLKNLYKATLVQNKEIIAGPDYGSNDLRHDIFDGFHHLCKIVSNKSHPMHEHIKGLVEKHILQIARKIKSDPGFSMSDLDSLYLILKIISQREPGTFAINDPFGEKQFLDVVKQCHNEILENPQRISFSKRAEVEERYDVEHGFKKRKIKPVKLSEAIDEKIKAKYPSPAEILGKQFSEQVAKLKIPMQKSSPLKILGKPHLQKLAEDLQVSYVQSANGVEKEIALNQFYNDYFSKKFETNDKLASFQKQLMEVVKKSNEEMISLQQQILKDLNAAPYGTLGLSFELSLMGRGTKEMNMSDAIALFLQNDLSYYHDKTHLDETTCLKIHKKIFAYLLISTRNQHHHRIISLLQQLSQPKLEEATKSQCYVQLGKMLAQKREYDPAENLDCLVFEHLENKLLDKNQFTHLSQLINPDAAPCQVKQMIMGGGKTSVVIPLLAQLFANGKNLSLVVVPQALFNTNYEYFSDISLKKFGKRVHQFQFTRDSECSVKALAYLKLRFRKAIIDREYFITTQESLQSLELKFLELLKILPTDDPFIDEKILHLQEILLDIKKLGVPIVDEVDKALSVRKSLNYTVGPPKSVPQHIVEYTHKLYQFMMEVPYETHGRKFALYDLIMQEAPYPSKKEWKKVFHTFADKLVQNDHSPLAMIIKKCGVQNKALIFNYLTEISDTECILTLSPQERDIMALYKEQLCHFLPESLLEKYNVYYGLSHNPKTLHDESEIAIPYESADTPNERSRFADMIVTLNYTIQTHMHESLSDELIMKVLKEFANTIGEIERKGQLAKEQREAFKTLFVFEFDIIADEIQQDLLSPKKLSILRENENVKKYCLLHYVLPSIKYYPVSLSSNSQSFVSMFDRFIGLTGTPWNERTFHSKIKRDSSIKTDGQIIRDLLRKEQPVALQSHRSETIEQLTTEIFSSVQDKERAHALIDLGALSAGKSNQDFAKIIALQAKLDNIKFILFFNDENQLCALSTDQLTMKPILIGSSDITNIQQVLTKHSDTPIAPKDWFMFYDQLRTRGADIPSTVDAIGMLTLDKDVILRELLQAAKRMRGMSQFQEIQFFVPKAMRRFYPEIIHWKVSDVIQIAINNQLTILSQEVLTSAFHKMEDVLRNAIMTELLHNKDPRQMRVQLERCKEILYQIEDRHYFEQYGAINTPKSVKELLIHKKNTISDLLLKLVQEKHLNLTKDIIENYYHQLESIIKETVDFVPPTMLSNTEQLSKKGGFVEVQTQLQAQANVQTQRQAEIFVNTNELTQVPVKPWLIPLNALEDIDLDHVDLHKTGVRIFSLEASSKVASKLGIHFSPDIYLSENFACSYQMQREETYAHEKHAVFVLNMYDPMAKQCKMMVITGGEVDEFRRKFDPSLLKKSIWIETISGIPVIGTPSAEAERSINYLNQKQQLHYITGNLSQLDKSLDKGDWLLENSKSKLQYLEQHILPLRDKPPLLSEIQTHISTLIAKESKESNESNEVKEVKELNETHQGIIENSYVIASEKPVIFHLKKPPRSTEPASFSLYQVWTECKKQLINLHHSENDAITRQSLEVLLEYIKIYEKTLETSRMKNHDAQFGLQGLQKTLAYVQENKLIKSFSVQKDLSNLQKKLKRLKVNQSKRPPT